MHCNDRPVSVRRCGRPHLYDDMICFWLSPCDVISTVNGAVPSGEAMARVADFSKRGEPLLGFFWSKLSNSRTSVLHLGAPRLASRSPSGLGQRQTCPR